MYQLIAVLGLDARRMEIGRDRDRGEMERGERAAIETDKVRNWLRGLKGKLSDVVGSWYAAGVAKSGS